MSSYEKLERLKYVLWCFQKRKPGVMQLEYLEDQRLAFYENETRCFYLSYLIADTILVHAFGKVVQILFPSELRALANMDWEGGDINHESIELSARCYVADERFDLVLPSTPAIDAAVNNGQRAEFCIYSIAPGLNSPELVTTFLQSRGEDFEEGDEIPPNSIPASEAHVISGRPLRRFKTIEPGHELEQFNSMDSLGVYPPYESVKRDQERAELLYGVIRMKSVGQVIDELRDEGVLPRNPPNLRLVK